MKGHVLLRTRCLQSGEDAQVDYDDGDDDHYDYDDEHDDKYEDDDDDDGDDPFIMGMIMSRIVKTSH